MTSLAKKKPARPAASPLQARSARVRTDHAFRYLLYLPKGYRTDARRQWPLLVFFHGRGERGWNLSFVKRHGPPKLIAQGHTFPFIVVSPQCSGEYWWNYPALEAFVDDIVRRYRVDLGRVYLTGLSMGGFATWALAENAPERYAAIAPVCGGGEVRLARRLNRLPVWAFHGAKDEIILPKRTTELVSEIKKAGGKPR
ncbi:MAG: phospholipase/carboxylesterase, partial [Verrucomicrobia bacterium]|nr:phospholipase/carboxylesterase [Verrucomicrobiota bacterium]